MRPVFARTRHHYDSYTDYWRLVELSGFETTHVDKMDLADDQAVYIVSPVNGEFRPHIEVHGHKKRCKVVWWNLERPDVDNGVPLVNVLDDMQRYTDEIWVSDAHYASLDRRQRHVVLGSHPGLAPSGVQTSAHARPYDFTHQSYVWGRRVGVLQGLGRLREGPNAWGELRDKVLRGSRLMVNVHQTPAPVGEPLRFALAAAYGLPLVTETLAAAQPLLEGVDFLAAACPTLAVRVYEALAMSPDRLESLGQSLHLRLCVDWTFRRGVEEAMRSFT